MNLQKAFLILALTWSLSPTAFAGPGPKYQRVTLTVANMTPGQKIVVQVTPQGPAGSISWTKAGPAEMQTGGAYAPRASNMTVTSTTVNPGTLEIQTASLPGATGSARLTVVGVLMASLDTVNFYLRNSTGSGTLQASVGEKQAQPVNATPTIFVWGMSVPQRPGESEEEEQKEEEQEEEEEAKEAAQGSR